MRMYKYTIDISDICPCVIYLTNLPYLLGHSAISSCIVLFR